MIVAVGTGNAPVAVRIGWTRQWPNRKVMRPSLRATNAGEIKNEIKTRIDESAVIVIKIVVKIERRIATRTRTRIVSGNDHAAVVIARVNDVIETSKSNPFLIFTFTIQPLVKQIINCVVLPIQGERTPGFPTT